LKLPEVGTISSVSEIRDALQAEGFNTLQLQGSSLQNQIRQLRLDAKKSSQG
jgi:hypothetical protein